MKRLIAPPFPAASLPSNSEDNFLPSLFHPELEPEQFSLQQPLLALVVAPREPCVVGISVPPDGHRLVIGRGSQWRSLSVHELGRNNGKGRCHLYTPPVAIKSESLLNRDQTFVELGGRLSLDETGALIKRRIPRHVGVSPQCHTLVPTGMCLSQRSTNEPASVSTPTMLGQHRKLLKVRAPRELEHVNESENGASGSLCDDQQEPGLLRPGGTGRCRLPSLRGQLIDKQLVCRVLNRLDGVVITRSRVAEGN